MRLSRFLFAIIIGIAISGTILFTQYENFVLKNFEYSEELNSSKNQNNFFNSNEKNIEFSTTLIKIDNTLLDVQLADTEIKRTRGLQFQEKLPYDKGMLFDFDEPRIISMWMPNMKFSLDMIWFDENGNVTHTEKNVTPCTSLNECSSYNGNGKRAKYVLEVTSGFVDKFNITNDSKLILEP